MIHISPGRQMTLLSCKVYNIYYYVVIGQQIVFDQGYLSGYRGNL